MQNAKCRMGLCLLDSLLNAAGASQLTEARILNAALAAQYFNSAQGSLQGRAVHYMTAPRTLWDDF